MKGIKAEFKYDFAEGLIQLIDDLLVNKHEQDDDRLVMAGLHEIRQRLYIRMSTVKSKYTITLSPVQSLALRILYTDYINDHKTYMGSKLMKIANDVKQHFS